MPFRPTIRSTAFTRSFSAVAVAASLNVTSLPDLGAATYTWTGAAGNNLWSGTSGPVTNWTPNFLPSPAQSIAFTGATPFSTVNLQTDRTINDVTFGGTQAYKLTGGSLAVTSGVINVNGAAVKHDVETPLTLGATGVFDVGDLATLSVERGVTDGANAYGLVKNGAGTLLLLSQSSNLHSLTTTRGVLDIQGTNVTTRLSNDFGFNFFSTTNVSHGSKLVTAPGGFMRVAGADLPVLTIDGAETAVTGSTYLLVGHSGVPGALDLRNRANVETAVLVVSIGNEGPMASTATIRSRATLKAGIVSIGGEPGAYGIVTVSDNETRVQADSIRLGGFNEGIYGGVTTMTVNEDAAVVASHDTSFFTSTSTLVVDRATFSTARLQTYNNALPMIRLANGGRTPALQITNADVNVTATYAGTIADVAGRSGGIVKSGAGNQILAGNSTYTGGTLIEGGTLTLGVANALPTNGAVTIAGGALNLAGNLQKTGAVTLSGGAINGSSPAIFLPTSMSLQSGTLAVPTIVSGAVTKTISGTATVNAPLTASSMTVSAGTLVLNQGATIPTVQVNAATLQLAGTLTGNLSSATGGVVALTGTTTLKGNMTLSGSLAVGAHTLVSDSSQALAIRTLTIAGGTVVAKAGMSLTGAASGHGTIAGKATGPVDASLTASGGTLTLGDAGDANGFTGFNGTLAAGASQLNVLSAGVANLGSANTVAGGTIASLNGLRLNLASTLSGFGVIQGNFANQGVVAGGSGQNVLTFTGAVSGAGSFAGNVQFEGSYSPGNSPAAVSFENLALTANSRVDVELGGTTAGSQFDQLNASGELALDGVLRVSLIDGFTPTAGQSFDLLNWASRSGQFASLQLPQLDGLFWDASQLYATGVLSVAAPLAADFNLDGSVDAADLSLWSTGFGAAIATREQGDANGDGAVDGTDFLSWQRQFGGSLAPASPTAVPVPEPAAGLLLALAAVGLNARRRRRR